MDKKKLLQHIVRQLETDLAELREATRATYDAATNEESKPENEYDTRALEASYLAGAQAQRLVEIEDVLMSFSLIHLRDFTAEDTVALSALVEVEFRGRRSLLFLLPKGGGTRTDFEGQSIQVISPNSLLGEALLGLKVGDEAIVEQGAEVKEYEILSLR